MQTSNQVVQVTARHGVYFHRMLSPVGRNMQYCASMFGVEVNNISMINRKLVCFLHSRLSDSDCCKVNVISELLSMSMSMSINVYQ